uniref:C2 domain-containing protein n=1 Tax=Tanacetum cinerariifolium TaxID=118510 RepID=A0A6L2JZY6_TANCI|nr:hypothetical protein [Tanacetum cinerariifolium]
MKPYALIYIEGNPGVFRTITDKFHGSNPVWESAFKFKLQPPFNGEANVVFEIRHQSWTRIDRRMGKVRIPLQQFLSGDANADRTVLKQDNLPFHFQQIQLHPYYLDQLLTARGAVETKSQAKERHRVLERCLTPALAPLNSNECKYSKVNQLVAETFALSGENDEDWITRVEILYKTHVGTEFKYKSAWLFLKGKHKWTNPESTNARRYRFCVTDEEPEHFGDDALPRPPGL